MASLLSREPSLRSGGRSDRSADRSSERRREGSSRSSRAALPSFKRGDPILRVLNGSQQGTAMALRKGGRLLIGTMPHDDVRLLTPAGDEQVEALLQLEKGHTALTLVKGGAWLDGQPVAPGVPHPLKPYKVVTLAGVAFAIGHAGSDNWAKIQLPSTLNPYQPGGEGSGPTPAVVPLLPTMQRERAMKHFVALGLFGLGLVVLGGGLMMYEQASVPPGGEMAKPAVDPLKQPLWATPDGAESTPGLGAAMASEARKGSSGSGHKGAGRAPDAEAVTAEVQQIFEAHRIPAEVITLETGRVLAVVEAKHEDASRRAARRALADVPAVREVVIEVLDRPDVKTQKPVRTVVNSQTKDSGARASDQAWLGDNDRVVQVRLGEVKSLLMTTGGRYFEGAQLPSGYTLEKISAERVQIGKNGGSRWVDLAPWMAEGGKVVTRSATVIDRGDAERSMLEDSNGASQ